MLKGDDGPDAEKPHAGLKGEPQPVLDNFVIVYWSGVLVLVAAFWFYLQYSNVDIKLLAEGGSYHDSTVGGAAWKWHTLQRQTSNAFSGPVEFSASGAGCNTGEPLNRCNGDYSWCGQHNGKSMYRNHLNAIVFFDEEWKMNHCDDTKFSCFSSGNTSGWEPPSEKWTISIEENETVTVTDVQLDAVHLPENMWSLCLISALGQAKLPGLHSKAKRYLQASTVAVISVFMAFLQIFGLFLVVHDIDPNSDPITTKPASPYGSVMSVNSMKVIMTLLLAMALVSEAGQCKAVFQAGMEVHASRLRSSRWLPLAMISIQYMVGLAVLWAGCCAILSFQSVPDIIYSSMAITCISNVDEFFYEAWQEVAGLDASFQVMKKPISDDAAAAPRDRRNAVHELPFVYHFLSKLGLFFPMLLGLAIFGRAWFSGHMPCERVTMLTSWVVSWFMR